jgi:hypothetical protein
MKYFFAQVLLVAILFSEVTQASALSQFLQNCAYGTGIGAVLGVVSLALTDKPGDSVGNIAKGASLGLYGGIAYGFYELNHVPAAQEIQGFAIIPVYQKESGFGAQAAWVYRFD